jgi:hypothetical protein
MKEEWNVECRNTHLTVEAADGELARSRKLASGGSGIQGQIE